MRLIDADKLIEHNRVNEILDVINEQPTAYSIDAVVEQIEDIQNFEMRTGKGYCPDRETECRYMNSDLGCGYCAFEKAIDIVKKGGGSDD